MTEQKDTKRKESKEEMLRRQSIERFLKYDQEKMISILNLPHDQETIHIDFLGKTYTIYRNSGELMQGHLFMNF